jgi:hypothetical protein
MLVGGVVGGGGVDSMMSCCVVHGCSTERERERVSTGNWKGTKMRRLIGSSN